MKIKMLQATPEPEELVGLAVDLTMKNRTGETKKILSDKTAAYLIRAEHTSLFEHVVYSFLISGISRSLLAQLTRQRTASPTSGSQHYQDYRDYDCAVLHSFAHTDTAESKKVKKSLTSAFAYYCTLVDAGVKPEEARQVLPNAACVNYLWTIDARNLMFFLRQRCCNRNVLEMRIFACRVLGLVRVHFPVLFNKVGPQCFMDRQCKQGHLQCESKCWEPQA